MDRIGLDRAGVSTPSSNKTNTQKQQPRNAAGKGAKRDKRGKPPFGGGNEDESPYVQADLCINNAAAVYNTTLVAAYVRLDPRLRGLIFLVKVRFVWMWNGGGVR